jgi:hypothetical protein
MKKMKKIGFGVLVSISLLMGSCYSDLENIEIGTLQWSPELGIPLLKSSFTVKDLLEEVDSTIDYREENNVLVLFQKEDSLFSSNAREYYEIPDRSFPSVPISLTTEEISEFNNSGSVTINREIAVDYLSDLDSIIIQMGTINLFIEENFPANGELSLIFSTFDNTNLLDYTYSWGYDGINAITTDFSSSNFSNATFAFAGSGDQGKVYIAYQLTLGKSGGIDLVTGQNSIDLGFNFENMEFEALFGNLNTQNISTERNTFDTDFFSQGEALDEFAYYLDDPRLKIIYSNTMGLPVVFNINNFTAYKNGNPDAITVNEEVRLSAATLESAAVNVASFDETFKELINDLPDSVQLQIDGVLDPDNTTNNFVTSNSGLQIGYEIEIPLVLSIQNLLFQESFEIDGLEADQLESALFKFNSQNSLPFNVNLKAVFLDADSSELHVLFDGLLLEAGQNGQASELIEYIRLENNPQTTSNELAFLQDVKKVGISVTIATSTPVDGVQKVEISASNKIDFSLAMQAKYNFNN